MVIDLPVTSWMISLEGKSIRRGQFNAHPRFQNEEITKRKYVKNSEDNLVGALIFKCIYHAYKLHSPKNPPFSLMLSHEHLALFSDFLKNLYPLI